MFISKWEHCVSEEAASGNINVNNAVLGLLAEDVLLNLYITVAEQSVNNCPKALFRLLNVGVATTPINH